MMTQSFSRTRPAGGRATRRWPALWAAGLVCFAGLTTGGGWFPTSAEAEAAAAPAPAKKAKNGKGAKSRDARNRATGNPEPAKDPALQDYGIYLRSSPHPGPVAPAATALPLELRPGDRVAFVGNTLFDRGAQFPHFEAMLHRAHPGHRLVVRTLAWPADEVGLMPRPDNFGDIHQHLKAVGADVVFAAFGFNESFAGEAGLPAFKEKLAAFLRQLRSSAYNGESAPRVVLVAPAANENVKGVPAADLNNARLAAYTAAMAEVAAAEGVGFADVFNGTRAALDDPATDLTFNGVHLVDAGYGVFAEAFFRETFGRSPPGAEAALREAVAEKNRQFFRRFRPLNTFYYTGGRNKRYGYLDFLPAMRSFEVMAANRDRRIWALAAGEPVPAEVDDSNVPPLPETARARGANEWLSPADEQAAFKVDPRVEVNLFASEEQFPEIACPIQLRWDARGRLWVSCSTTYPHVYPGNEPDDKIVILEDTDGDGRADQSSVFADGLQVPLSFELGDGGVYVSEEPHLTFLKDTDGDGRADFRRQILTGFGCEDSHHALHDFVWTPDGDLLFREAIFHHSQVETPYGPVRTVNSSWFRFTPRTQRLVAFGSYPNTNPWGVTFTGWGYHVASHPIFASAFHTTNPPYPAQHPRAAGIPAYSGVCGHVFVDFAVWPEEFQGGMVKVRYKPTNRVEFHRWVEKEDHFAEEYQGDLVFSTNLSFIPVDLKFGPRGALYVADWYNPVKGHAQYSLRDERRDRTSGRIWRIVPKGARLPDPVPVAGRPLPELLRLLERPERHYRYRARRELRERDPAAVRVALGRWSDALDRARPRYLHHRAEALWMARAVDAEALELTLIEELLASGEKHARAAAARQLRHRPPARGAGTTERLLRTAATDDVQLVRMEAVTSASHVGTAGALDAILPALDLPAGSHLAYTIACALGSESLSHHWKNRPGTLAAHPQIDRFIKAWQKVAKRRRGTGSRTASEAAFDSQKNLRKVTISCLPERLLYTVDRFEVKAGQPVKLTFTNPDVTAHNLVITQPGAADEVGIAGNEMAKDPNGQRKHYIPPDKKHLILHFTKLLEQDTSEVLRFRAPEEPGDYPYVCTFPGHWIVMRGVMAVR